MASLHRFSGPYRALAAVLLATFMVGGAPLPSAHAWLRDSSTVAVGIGIPLALRGDSPPAQLLPTLSDGGSLQTPIGGGQISSLNDSIDSWAGTGGTRSYRVVVTATIPVSSKAVSLSTWPGTQWAHPGMLPWGPDGLPPLADWSWWATGAAGNDTANWTAASGVGELTRPIAWANATFTIFGSTFPAVSITVGPAGSASPTTPGTGFSLNGPAIGPKYGATDPTLARLASGVKPTMVRAGLASLGTIVGWNNTTGGLYNFAALDWFLGFAKNLSAEAYLSLPVGTWGNGNQLPGAMPLNYSLVVSSSGSNGSFPTPASYTSFVSSIASHVLQANESVTYWNIGNEVPISNGALFSAYVTLFNDAARSIHAVFPAALVGSDVMTDPAYLAAFAQQTRGVGFLAFHYYPAQSVCVQNGSYCPPGTGGLDLTDAQIWDVSSGYGRLHTIELGQGQRQWHNLTGQWVPVIDAESNLNTAGGNTLSSPTGTDPRQETLFAAAWTVSMLIDAAASNVSRFNYFSFLGPMSVPTSVTGPYGGWGFGLASVGPNGNVSRFAPWWALEMWGQNVPAGTAVLPTTVSDLNVSRALAVRNGTGDAAILVNRANVPVRFSVTDSTFGPVPIQVTTLDRSTYVEGFNSSSARESLVRSGVAIETAGPANNVQFLLAGYGVATVLFGSVPPTPKAPGTPSLVLNSTFFEATVLGVVLLVVVTIVAFRPHRRRHPPAPPTAPSAPPAPPATVADDTRSEDDL